MPQEARSSRTRWGNTVGEAADHFVGEAEALGLPEQARVQGLLEQAELHVVDVVEFFEKKDADGGAAGEFVGTDAAPQGGHESPEALVVGGVDEGGDVGGGVPGGIFPEEGAAAEFQAADGLVEGGFHGALDGHDLAGGLHLGAEAAVATGELVEGPARDLDYHVVQGRLEGGGGLPGDGVGDFVQGAADGDPGGDAGDGVAGGLGRQGGGAADAGIGPRSPGIGRTWDRGRTGCCSRLLCRERG